MFFKFEIILGEATDFGGVWEEQDILDFLGSEVCSKISFYKKRKIFNFCIDLNLDDLKECKAVHYLKYLQKSYLRVVDMQELLLLYSHYEFYCGLNPIYLSKEGEQIILTYWNDRGRKRMHKVMQAYFYAKSIDDTEVILNIDFKEANCFYTYSILEKDTRRSIEFVELCNFLERYDAQGKVPPKLKRRVISTPPPCQQIKFKMIDGIICAVEAEKDHY